MMSSFRRCCRVPCAAWRMECRRHYLAAKPPIRLPGEAMLLAGHELPTAAGYTPMFIGSSKGRSHVLERPDAGRAHGPIARLC